MDKLLKYNGVQEALKFLREDDERTLQEHLEMCQIPAPSYEEGEKAEYVRKKMVDAGLSDVHIDEVGNVRIDMAMVIYNWHCLCILMI